jgi:hypothetical protein
MSNASRPHRVVQLCSNNNFVAAGKVGKRSTEHDFALAAPIHVGGIKEGDAEFQGAFYDMPTRCLVEAPRSCFDAKAHAAQCDARNLQT